MTQIGKDRPLPGGDSGKPGRGARRSGGATSRGDVVGMEHASAQMGLALVTGLRDAGVISPRQMERVGRSMVEFFKQPSNLLTPADLDELRGVAGDIVLESGAPVMRCDGFDAIVEVWGG